MRADEASVYEAEQRAGVYDSPETENPDPDWLYELRKDRSYE